MSGVLYDKEGRMIEMNHTIIPDVRLDQIKRKDREFWEATVEVSYHGHDSIHMAEADTPMEAFILAAAKWYAFVKAIEDNGK